MKGVSNIIDRQVTPCVGVWIETGKTDIQVDPQKGHTLRGCVD